MDPKWNEVPGNEGKRRRYLPKWLNKHEIENVDGKGGLGGWGGNRLSVQNLVGKLRVLWQLMWTNEEGDSGKHAPEMGHFYILYEKYVQILSFLWLCITKSTQIFNLGVTTFLSCQTFPSLWFLLIEIYWRWIKTGLHKSRTPGRRNFLRWRLIFLCLIVELRFTLLAPRCLWLPPRFFAKIAYPWIMRYSEVIVCTVMVLFYVWTLKDMMIQLISF